MMNYIQFMIQKSFYPYPYSSYDLEIMNIQCTTGELGYDGPLYDGFLHMTDDMLGPSLMHIKYSSYVYDGICI